MSVFVRPANCAMIGKKALPSQPAQTWPPFLKVQVIMEGRLFTTFPPQTSFIKYTLIEPQKHDCATQTLRRSLERVFEFNFGL